jgi:hypothetical protein
MTLQLLLYLLGFVCLILAAVGVGVPRVSLGWLGLALWLFAAAILPAIQR